ncbi:MAG: hypothetical protein IJ187_04890 [Neisseriaceae bacterium]|nr:hypothetical protein [Neisseriaceae bacterium]MBQ9725332.1 hypothetical protein [Neisseriaceae bacterium]
MLSSNKQEEIKLFNPTITALLGIICLPVACYFYAKNCQTLNQSKNRLLHLSFAIAYIFCLLIYYILSAVLSIYHLDEIMLMFDKGYYRFFWLYSILFWYSILGKPNKDYIKEHYPNYKKQNIILVVLFAFITRIILYGISLFFRLFIG